MPTFSLLGDQSFVLSTLLKEKRAMTASIVSFIYSLNYLNPP